MRKHWAIVLGVAFHTQFLLDTKPVPVVGYKRSKRRSDFASSAAYGVCASRNMKYFGYKLVMLSTLDGIPVAYELVPANSDERAAAEEVLSAIWNSDIYGDKGFLGEIWQQEQYDNQGNRIWTIFPTSEPLESLLPHLLPTKRGFSLTLSFSHFGGNSTGNAIALCRGNAHT